jgi:hypothetical protein
VVSHHEKMMADMRTWRKEMETDGEVMEACLGKTEANPEETESESEHPEIPEKEAEVEIFGALKKPQGGRHLAVGLRGNPKERTQGICGSRKKLASADRRMTRRTEVSRRKGHGRKVRRQGQCCKKKP